MVDSFRINDVYDKNINFLIGSGASHGLIPTLSLKIKGNDGESLTLESLATSYDIDNPIHSALFMYYYKSCIEPAINIDIDSMGEGSTESNVISNYEKFIGTILSILQIRNNGEKSCNIFTTNYDGCFVNVADSILKKGNIDFIINDGARGFSSRYLEANNFNSFVYQTGVFDQHRTDLPQINLIHLHGSIYWNKEDERIRVDYSEERNNNIQGEYFNKITNLVEILEDDSKTISDIPQDTEITEDEIAQFWMEYKNLPIVNPTKWKFHETVFDEHYYQMLRLLSYELEKPNSVFVTFGFSFADEHILNLVRRSLSNPKLQLFVCCFNVNEKQRMSDLFKPHNNVQIITVDGQLDFTAFNNDVFTLTPSSKKEQVSEVGAGNVD